MDERKKGTYKTIMFCVDDELYYKLISEKKRLTWEQCLEQWLQMEQQSQ
jgi:hypothetical protein